MGTYQKYYVPSQSHWPIVAAMGLFFTMGGLALLMAGIKSGNSGALGLAALCLGAVIMVYMFYGWFGSVVRESSSGLYSDQLSQSFRKGMSWFIFSEVMFFAAFFGVLFYVRMLVVPWLAGDGDKGVSHMLWPDFVAHWPLLKNPDPVQFNGPKSVIDPWHIPLINTLLLISSSVTLTIAHHALKEGNRGRIKIFMGATLVLGVAFLCMQVSEYVSAYQTHGLTLETGIYASTFFLLTGFHGAHVTIGGIMLTVMFVRILKGHFTEDSHFAFEASAWYWHFVDVIWLLLFMLVYVL